MFIVKLKEFSMKTIKDTFFLKKTFLVSQYHTLKSIVVQYNSWPTGVGIKWKGKKSYRLHEGEKWEMVELKYHQQ